jgi:hypothetical protein
MAAITRRFDVVVGDKDDFVVALHGANADLLIRHSALAKDKLTLKTATRFAVPGAKKDHLIWVYQQMVVGDKLQSLKKIEEFSVVDLKELHDLCETLGYASLKAKLEDRLKAPIPSPTPSLVTTFNNVPVIRLSSKSKPHWLTTIKCFKCSGQGHLARNCPEPPRPIAKKPVRKPLVCYKCGISGRHVARNCNTADPNEEARRGQVTALGLRI